MAPEKSMNRRAFLKGAAMAAVGVAVAACARPTPVVVEKQVPVEKVVKETVIVEKQVPVEKVVKETVIVEKPVEVEKVVIPSKYNEAPMLAELVKAGKLPPVDQRIPQDVMVVGPGTLIPADMVDWQVGKYGGTMRYCTARTDVCAELYDATNEPPLMTPGLLRASSVSDVKPNFFKAWEVSPDGKSITFHMRKGVKWSDGQPCTTADVKFWYEDVLLNEKITPTIGRDYRTGYKPSGEVMKLEVIDDYTFKVTYGAPAYNILVLMSGYGYNPASWICPAHYMKQFHQKYAKPEELKKLLDEAKLPEAEWWRYFVQRNEQAKGWSMLQSQDPNYPRINPWIVEKVQAGLATWVRNPYYWKVDTAGNQLPYIDRLRIEIVADSQSVTMKMMAGEVDWAREYASTVNLPLYKEHEKKGLFKVYFMDMHVAPLQLSFNFTHPDPVWRQVVGDVRFRKALNMAINGQKIVDTVYQGFGKPTEIFGLTYDKAGAAKLLDEVLPNKDSEGWRLGPDGKRFVFPLEVRKGYTPEQDAVCELLVSFWQEIGLKTEFKNVEATLYNTRDANNELYVSMRWAHTGYWRLRPHPTDFRPDVARLWTRWMDSAGKDPTGEEPPAWAKRLWEIADICESWTISDEEMRKLQAEMFQILKEQVPMVIPMDHGVYPLVGSTKLGNVPTKGYAIVASFTQEEWFFKA